MNGYKTVVLLGLGRSNRASGVAEAQSLGKAVASICVDLALSNVEIALGEEIKVTSAFKENFGHGVYEGLYSDNRYRKKIENQPNSFSISTVKLLSRGKFKVDPGWNSFRNNRIAAGVKFARDLVGSSQCHFIVKYNAS